MHRTTHTRILRRLAALGTLIAALVLAGCSAPSSSAPTASTPAADSADMLAEHDLAGLDTKQVIERLDTMPVADRPADLMASIRPDELQLSDDQQRTASLPMPADEFYISFAPYLSQTHDCHFHSLTTCKGELQNADIHVKVVDATGTTIVDEASRTYDNGFLGLWLPRGLNATLTVDYQGRSATIPITTEGADAATCLTTLELQ